MSLLQGEFLCLDSAVIGDEDDKDSAGISPVAQIQNIVCARVPFAASETSAAQHASAYVIESVGAVQVGADLPAVAASLCWHQTYPFGKEACAVLVGVVRVFVAGAERFAVIGCDTVRCHCRLLTNLRKA